VNETLDLALYRPNVGLALFHPDGRVFLGRRVGLRAEAAFAWQMPQGGIDPGEAPREAALRELGEEVGVAADLVRVLHETPDWIAYDFPQDLTTKRGGRLRDHWRGQKQKWFALGFLGKESDIHLDSHVQEFAAWRWAALDEAPELVVPFKRPVYDEVARRFAPYAAGGWL
jgi:putative (di)nucleoside polyphosphate hydrolase